MADLSRGRRRPQIRTSSERLSVVKSGWQKDHDLLTLKERQIARRGRGVDLGVSRDAATRTNYVDDSGVPLCNGRARRISVKQARVPPGRPRGPAGVYTRPDDLTQHQGSLATDRKPARFLLLL
ncbi:hypothetical protein E2C01_040399 [Portunus trituberculatus]|uniref:Uncharacterized protein n=1 Tax=Portunus trituberculatus TaxID=210409 RepID=A0A5B7FQN8_PORTR|nr:hypothetical protein [Portunus trituberculatus]